MRAPLLSLRNLYRTIWRLLEDRSGLALVEFAYSLPLLTAVGLYGAEVANYATVKMRISQTALNLADNASRIGENGVLQDIKIYESDINDIFTGAEYANRDIDLATNGRMILSSLQQNGSGGQWIAWQRCDGSLSYSSSYGVQGDGATGTSFPGMGPSEPIKAASGTAVMFVEIAYTYQPLFSEAWIPGPEVMSAIATFNVRDDRDLSQVYPTTGVTASTCT